MSQAEGDLVPALEPGPFRDGCHVLLGGEPWSEGLKAHCAGVDDAHVFFCHWYHGHDTAVWAAMRFWAVLDFLGSPEGCELAWTHEDDPDLRKTPPEAFEAAAVVPLTLEGEFLHAPFYQEFLQRTQSRERFERLLGEEE